MLDEAHKEKKQGALTVLALFIAVLLGQGGVAAAAELDSRAARLGQSDPARSGAILRSAVRSAAEEADPDELPALLPPKPQLQSDFVAIQPASLGLAGLGSATPSQPARAYRARAPPSA